MSEIRIPIRDGWVIVFDSEDMEAIGVSFTQHPGLMVDGPNASTHTLPSGSCTLDLSIRFENGRKPQWVQTEPKPA